MVEIKDVLLIGGLAGAGLLAYKAISGGYGKGAAYTPSFDWSSVQGLVSDLKSDNAETRSTLAATLEAIAAKGNNPQAITVNIPSGSSGQTVYIPVNGGDGNGGDGNGNNGEEPPSNKELVDLSRTATVALDQLGSFGPIRQAFVEYDEAADRSRAATVDTPVSDLSDDLQKTAMTGLEGVGFEPATAGVLGNLASDVAMGGPFGAIATLLRGLF